jgi:hypothetical protein
MGRKGGKGGKGGKGRKGRKGRKVGVGAPAPVEKSWRAIV